MKRVAVHRWISILEKKCFLFETENETMSSTRGRGHLNDLDGLFFRFYHLLFQGKILTQLRNKAIDKG